MNLLTELQKYLEYCEYRKELSHNTLKAYRIDLRQYISFIGGDFLQKPRIEEYITKLHKEFKQKTVKRKIASVKAFYRYLEEEEILKEANPFDRIRVKFKEVESLPRIIPREDIEKTGKLEFCARTNIKRYLYYRSFTPPILPPMSIKHPSPFKPQL